MFPWLWDLDINMVRKKQHDGHWNWELLVRQLSLKKIHEPDDRSIKLPLQLRNRRRIWRLFEEARVHDVAGLQEELMAARVSIKKQLSVPLVSFPTGLTPQEFPGFDSFKLPQRWCIVIMITRGTGINGMRYYYLGVRPTGNIHGSEYQLYDYSAQLSSGFIFKDIISQSSIQLPIYNIKVLYWSYYPLICQ